MDFCTLFNIPKDNPMLNNIYKPVASFEDYYQVSSDGHIHNYRKQLKHYVINSGYACVKLTVNKVRSSHLIHRLVAKAFVPNPENKKEVNHIDGNKLNNNAYNLEWVTSSENKNHAYATGLKQASYNTLGKKHKSTKSKFHNVGWDSQRNKWNAAVRHNGKSYFQKRFNTEEEAALHVNWILDELQLFDRPRNVL